MDEGRARRCQYVVCTQNAHNVEAYADGTEDHGSAFLVGRISRIVPATAGDPARWKFQFRSAPASVSPDMWMGDRNTLLNNMLEDMAIDLSDAKLEGQPTSTQAPTTEVDGLTIRLEKAGLARTYDVDGNAIEVVIRG